MSHEHGRTASTRRLVIALAITAAVCLAEAVGAVLTGSLAVLVDAGHLLTDVLALGIAVAASRLMARTPTDRHTWGWRRAEVLGALAQAALLLGVGAFALVEGIRRLAAPPEVGSGLIIVLGGIGLLANLASVAVLAGGRSGSLNARAAFLEVLSDALTSVGVIVAGVLILALGWTLADPIIAIVIAVLIIPRTVVLLRQSASVLLESTPPGLDLAEVRQHLLDSPGVVAVHDLHASLVSTDLPVLSAHIVVTEAAFAGDRGGTLLRTLQTCAAEHFPISIEHSTFQIEPESHPEEHAAHV